MDEKKTAARAVFSDVPALAPAASRRLAVSDVHRDFEAETQVGSCRGSQFIAIS